MPVNTAEIRATIKSLEAKKLGLTEGTSPFKFDMHHTLDSDGCCIAGDTYWRKYRSTPETSGLSLFKVLYCASGILGVPVFPVPAPYGEGQITNSLFFVKYWPERDGKDYEFARLNGDYAGMIDAAINVLRSYLPPDPPEEPESEPETVEEPEPELVEA